MMRLNHADVCTDFSTSDADACRPMRDGNDESVMIGVCASVCLQLISNDFPLS